MSASEAYVGVETVIAAGHGAWPGVEERTAGTPRPPSPPAAMAVPQRPGPPSTVRPGFAAPRVEPKAHERELTLNGHSHLATCLAAIGLVGLAYAGLSVCLSRESWAYRFFFERSFVQWVTLGVFLFGLGVLVERLVVYGREARALGRIKRGEGDTARGSVVWQRHTRLLSFMHTRPSEDVQPYATYLAECDAAELESGYCLLGDVVQMLPLLGFFGTVLGLTIGLQQQFLAQGAGGHAFAQAIATAFDTTLLGLACTILMILFQRPLRKREEALLAGLDRFVDAEVVRSGARSGVESAAQDWMQAALEQFAGRLGETGRALAAETRAGIVGACESAVQNAARQVHHSAAAASSVACREISAAASGVVATFRTEMLATAERVAAKLGDAQAAHDARQADALARPVAEAVQKALTPVGNKLTTIQQLVANIEARNGRAAQTVAEAVRDHLTALGDRMSRALARPRRMSLVETPCGESDAQSPETAHVAPKA